MKRNINLQPLSRDHHHGLLLGWKIRQGLKRMARPELISEYVQYFSDKALMPHFREEEEFVLCFLADDDPYKERTLNEHSEIRTAISNLSETDGQIAALLLELAETLDSHIRFEERELFPYMERKLSAEQLQELGTLISGDHQPFVEDFHSEFWVAKVDEAEPGFDK